MSRIGTLIWRKIFESGDARRLAKQTQDLSDLIIMRDIPYLDDGDRGHLLDFIRLPDTSESAPVMINIHGGGLFASYKEVNANFNYAWARMGYRVISLSYRRIPETTLYHQISDIMTALCFIRSHHEALGLNLDRCFLTGDSAGALLCLFAMAINGSAHLQKTFGMPGSGISFRACGLISIMLDTRRRDLMRAISSQITGPEDRGRPWEAFLLDPVSLIPEAQLPPVWQVTSAEDLIRRDSLKMEKALTIASKEHVLRDFPRGTERKLVHVFPVAYPMYPESMQVFHELDAFFRAR